MRIPLDQITEAGLKITADQTDNWVDQAARSLRGTPGEPGHDRKDDSPTESAAITFEIERVADLIHVGGQMQITVQVPCDRCGGSLRVELAGDVDLHYKPPGDNSTESDHDLEQSEMNVGWHDGQAIDLELVTTEQLSLWAPDRLLCDNENAHPADDAGPCELPESASDGAEGRTNPFAGLRLPE